LLFCLLKKESDGKVCLKERWTSPKKDKYYMVIVLIKINLNPKKKKKPKPSNQTPTNLLNMKRQRTRNSQFFTSTLAF